MSRPAPSRLVADGLLLLITAVWGATFVVVKDALADADAFTFLALRFGVGALAAALVARSSLSHPVAWRHGLTLGLLLFVGYSLQTWGLAYTTPSRSAFITGLSVVLVPFVVVLTDRQRPELSALAGAALAVTGLWLLTGAGAAESTLVGDLLTVGCTIAYAFHIALTSRYARQAPSAALVTVQLGVTAALSAAVLPFAGARLEVTSGLVWAVLLTGLVASAFAIIVQTWAQAHTRPVDAVLIYALEPAFAAALSLALGREALTPSTLVGGALIASGTLTGRFTGLARWLLGAKRAAQ